MGLSETGYAVMPITLKNLGGHVSAPGAARLATEPYFPISASIKENETSSFILRRDEAWVQSSHGFICIKFDRRGMLFT
jgi:hypothetical protein